MRRKQNKFINLMVGVMAGTIVLLSACGSGSQAEGAAEAAGIAPAEEPATADALDASAREPVTADVLDTGQGIISSISMAKFEAMMEAGQTFLVSFVTTDCPYCHDFHAMLEEYNKDHAIIMYQVILDYEETGEEVNREIVHQYFEEFETVPGVFYVENGEKSSYLDTYNLGVGEEVFAQWIIDIGIDTTGG